MSEKQDWDVQIHSNTKFIGMTFLTCMNIQTKNRSISWKNIGDVK